LTPEEEAVLYKAAAGNIGRIGGSKERRFGRKRVT
jgi:hypothetical protein